MKTKINLSDLVMLQMMGSLDEYVGELTQSSGNHDAVVAETRERASTPGVFDEIVKKSINAQFGQTYAIVRELAQNGKDAYFPGDTSKRVEFSTDTNSDNFVLTARDYGVGMAPIEVIRDLLVPYNSGKDRDSEKIGEHGIGWYSIMDLANGVQVVTGKNGVRTTATIDRNEGVWQAEIDTSKGDFQGTEVKAIADPSKSDNTEIRRQLEKNVGLCDPKTVQITLDGNQINTISREYRLGGQSSINYKGKTDTLDLSFKRNGHHDKKVIMTQDGLFIREEDIPFQEGGLHYNFMNSLIEEGFNFWFDLPTNVGLTKGRNNVVSRDRPHIYQAMLPTLEQCILDVVLEDEKLVKKLDSKIANWVRNIFYNTYQLEAYKEEERSGQTSPMTVTKVERVRGNERGNLEGRISKGKVEQPDTIIVVYGEDHFKDIQKPEITDAKQRELEKIAKEYHDGMSDFSHKLFEKQFIRAQKCVGEEFKDIRVSINDMIQAYARGVLYDGRWHKGGRIDGIYVDSSLDIVRTVLFRLDKMREDRKAAVVRKSAASNGTPVSDSQSTSDSDSDGHGSQRESRSARREEKDTTIVEIVNRTNLKRIKGVTEAEGCGQEYQGFLEVANYLDELISKANDLYGSPVMMHYNERMLFNVEIAHTDREGISFNFADRTAYSLVERVRTGSLDMDTMMKLADILVHEKTHCKRSEYDATPEHGRTFYEEDKKQMRENFIAYCWNNGVDPLKEANGLLSQRDFSIRTDPKRFGQLVEKYTSPEFVRVKNKR
jgi:hypothetical protein